MSIHYVKPNTIKVTQLPCPITIKGVDAFVIHFNGNFFSITSGDYPLSMLDKSFSEILDAVQKELIIYMIDDNGTYVQYNFNGNNVFVFAGTAFEIYEDNDQTYIYLINITLFIDSDNIYFNRAEGYINDYELLINKPYIPENVSDLNNDLNFVESSDLASVATSGDYNDLQNTPNLAAVATSGSYNDLTDKPTIVGQVQSDWNQSDSNEVDFIKNKPTLGTMAAENASDYTPTASLAGVATSGDYNDLDNKPTIPTIPTDVSAFSNDVGYITGIDSNDVVSALGYTPGTSNFSGSYTDLTDKPTIPDDLADLNDDSTHRLVTDTEKTTWNNKSDFSGSYNDLTDLPTLPNGTYIGTSTNWGQNTGVSYLRTSYFQYSQVPQKKGDLVYSTGTRNLHVCGDVVWDSDQNCYKTTPVYIGNFAAPVNADWNSNSGLSQILNKPDLSVYALDSDLNNIEDLIPSAATDQNQLADKAFVNSSISNMAANYVTSDAQGDNFSTKASLISGPYYHKGQVYTLTENDYALVESDETKGNATTRYIYDGSQWSFQYIVNNTPFTQSQLDAINSGITANKVSGYDSLVSNVQADWNAQSGLAQILNKPTIPANTSDLNNDSGFITTETDPTVPAWAKAANKPTYTASEVGALPDTTIWYGESTTAAATVQKEVSIPSITTLRTGQIIIVKPTITSTVANSTLKLNNFDAYPMRYNNAAITTSTDSIVWNANYTSQFVFDGTYWQFAGHGLDSNTTYSAMSVAEGTAGTATSSRTMRADYLKQIIEALVPGAEEDPVFAASAASGISSSDIDNWNDKTSNIGTITEITMNGTSKGTSGNVDLGTVITSETQLSKGTTTGNGNAVTDISVNNHQITLTKGKTFLESFTETDPVFSASAAAGIQSSDITAWNGKQDPASTLSGYGITDANISSRTVTLGSNSVYVPNILSGNSAPTSGQGSDGDLYLQLV